MSRVAKNPISIPGSVVLKMEGKLITLKKGQQVLSLLVHDDVSVTQSEGELQCSAQPDIAGANAMAGTTRALISNMVIGLTTGYKKELQFIGVGYRAKVSNNIVDLSLGFSHPVMYEIPDGILVEAPSTTELIISGIDKQKVGQVAAEIRAFRPPEPYKGKGVRYKGEIVKLKEGKSK